MGDVPRLPDATCWLVRRRLIEHRLPIGVRHPDIERGVDQSRRDGVDAHGCPLKRQTPRQRLQRRVDGTLKHRGSARALRQEARNEGDRPPVSDPRSLRDAVSAEELAVHRGLRIGEREVGDRAGLRARRRDDEMIERHRTGEEGLDRCIVGDLKHVLAWPLDLGASRLEGIGGRPADAP